MAPNEEIQAPSYESIALNADQIASEIIRKIINDAILLSNTSRRCMLWTNKIVDFEMSITALKLVDKVIYDAFNEITNGKGDAPDDSKLLKDELKKCAIVLNAIFFDKGDVAGSLEDINQLDCANETYIIDQIREPVEIIESDAKEELPGVKSDEITNDSAEIYDSQPLFNNEQPVRNTSQNYQTPLMRDSMKRGSWMRTLLRKPMSLSKSDLDEELPIKQQAKPTKEALEVQSIHLNDDQPVLDNSIKIRSWKRSLYLKPVEFINSDSNDELPARKSDKIAKDSVEIYSVPLIDDEQPVRNTSQNYQAPWLRDSMKRSSWIRTLLLKPMSLNKSDSDEESPIKQQIEPTQEAVEVQSIRPNDDDQPVLDNLTKIRSWKRSLNLKTGRDPQAKDEPTLNRTGSILGRTWRNVTGKTPPETEEPTFIRSGSILGRSWRNVTGKNPPENEEPTFNRTGSILGRSWRNVIERKPLTNEEPTPDRTGSILGRSWRNVVHFFSWNLK